MLHFTPPLYSLYMISGLLSPLLILIYVYNQPEKRFGCDRISIYIFINIYRFLIQMTNFYLYFTKRFSFLHCMSLHFFSIIQIDKGNQTILWLTVLLTTKYNSSKQEEWIMYKNFVESLRSKFKRPLPAVFLLWLKLDGVQWNYSYGITTLLSGTSNRSDGEACLWSCLVVDITPDWFQFSSVGSLFIFTRWIFGNLLRILQLI